MNKELFEKYRNIREQIETLEGLETELRQRIIEEMNTAEVEKVESDFGKFTIYSTTKYTFSDEFKAIQEVKKNEMKSLEQSEIASGKANETIIKSLRFTKNK